MAGRMVAVAVGRKTAGEIETRMTLGDRVQEQRRDGADQLRDDIGNDLPAGKRPPAVKPTVMAGLRWQPEIRPISMRPSSPRSARRRAPRREGRCRLEENRRQSPR